MNTGVLPVYENEFKVGVKGLASTSPTDMKTVADMETFSVSFDNGVEEWHPMDTKGWVRKLMTAKAITISLTGKRNIGDEGNDYLAGLALKNGQDANTKFEWVMIDGSKLEFNCVVSVTALGGDSTAVDALEVEISSDGAPTFTPAEA